VVLNVDHGVFDLIQKKAASICGLDRRVFSLGKANPSIVKLGGRCAERAVCEMKNKRYQAKTQDES
jgi:hypothetical protein